MALEITGKIAQILPIETGEGKNGQWKKQFFVLDFMEGNYPKKVSISFWGDKTDALKGLQPGQNVKVSFNVESREYNGRWYTDVKAWRLETLDGSQQGNSNSGPGQEPEFSSSDNQFSGGPDNDLPF